MISHPGEWAALGTALCFALTSIAFESASRRVGSLPVNWIRLVAGLGFLTVLRMVLQGEAWPHHATGHQWVWLGISGLIGFSFGDLCLFRAFVLIGARLAMLLMSLVPLMAAGLGAVLLGERLGPLEWLGMALTVGGVTWVIRERTPDATGVHRHPSVPGVLLGLGGALGQAVGLVLSKYGMGDGDPWESNQIRVIAGLAGFTVLFFFTRSWPAVARAVRQPVAMGWTALGSFFGPFLGVSLSLLAVRYTTSGVAATIMAMTPVLVIPIDVFLRKRPVSARGWIGAMVAVVGVALLFLGP